MRLLNNLMNRALPALLMASSVTLLTAGLLSYAPSAFGDRHTPEPEIAAGDPLLQPTPSPIGRPTPTPVELTSPTPSQPPFATPSPGTPAVGIASRIRIPSLDIDLPIVASDLVVPGNLDLYPLCDVATFMRGFVQPGQEGTTYIYGHAQREMFAPLLKASLTDNGASMIGALVEVYTSDNELHLYEISLVKRHATDLSLAIAPAGEHQLVLQTSEGPSGTVPKLQILARPLSVVPTSAAEANPEPHPRVCLPG